MEPSLDLECRLLCRQIFGLEAPSACLDAYHRAHAQVFGPAEAADLAWVAGLASNGWDLEALEISLRQRDPANVLSKKFQILFYLIEATPQGYPLFVNEEGAAFKAWASLAFNAIRTLYKSFKGRLLLWRLGV